MEDVRDVDSPATQWHIERRGDMHRQQRTKVVPHDVDESVDLIQRLAQPVGVGILARGEAIRTARAKPGQRDRH